MFRLTQKYSEKLRRDIGSFWLQLFRTRKMPFRDYIANEVESFLSFFEASTCLKTKTFEIDYLQLYYSHLKEEQEQKNPVDRLS